MADATVTIGWNNSLLEAGVARAKGIVSGFKGSAKAALDGIGVGQMLGGAGALVGAKSFLDYMGRVADMADRLDASAEAVQRLDLIAKTSGTDIESVATSLLKVERALFDVENSRAAAAFKTLGISAENFEKLQPDQQMVKLTEAFQESEQSGKGFVEIYDLVGKKAGNLLPILRSNIDAMREQASTQVFSEDQVRQMDELGDRYTQLSADIGGFTAQFADFLGAVAAGTVRGFQGEDPLNALRDLEKLRNEGNASREEELAKRKKARIDEINRREAEAAQRREEEQKKLMALEAERARKKLAEQGSAAGNLMVDELRASGRGRAADKLARELKFNENVEKFRELAPEKGDQWARDMARRRQRVDDKMSNSGIVRGVEYHQPEKWSGLNWLYGHNADRGGRRLGQDFKFPALDAMKRMQAKDEKKPPNEVTDDILKQMLELWRGALGTS